MLKMTLKEATEIVNLYLQHSDQWNHQELDDALKLLIKAGEWRLKEKDAGHIDRDDLLPGEKPK